MNRGRRPRGIAQHCLGVEAVLGGVPGRAIEPIEKRRLGNGMDPDGAQAQLERDKMLADAQPQAALMNRGEESSLRQVWRTTHLLMNIKKSSQHTIKYRK